MELLQNHLLNNALIAWVAAQIIKAVIYLVVNRTFDIHRLLGDGGMPSGHSATVTALAVTAAIEYGLSSSCFAISLVLAVIVMHDAMGVRREAGKHAKALNELLNVWNSDAAAELKMKELLGHTPLQVGFGALLGLVVALLLG